MAPPPPNPPDPPVPSWLRGLPRAPEYRPTESEFADPIAFLSRVEREAAAFGICKVIPPYPRPSRRFVFAHFNRSLSSSDSPSPPSSPSSSSSSVFTTRHQELGTPRRPRPPQVLKQVWQSGEHYTLEQFEAKSRAFSRTHLAGLREPSPLAVESLFWKAAADRPIYIEYANDVPGSGFAAPVRPRRKKRKREGVPLEEGEKGAGWRLSNSPWNLQAIARAPGSLTRFMPDDVPGVTSPMVYIGMLFSWFAWHVEDHELHSLNFLHTGMPKTWYAVPGDRAAELEEVIRVHGYGGDSDRLASLAVLGEKTTLMSPEVLVACGVPCCRLVQYPGEFVVTFPRAYHVGFSHGFNCGEAANFATPQWLKFAKDAAVRRAVMNYLPMLSHQQLLYLLAVSFISRTPRELLSGIRNSRLRDRRKEERELLVKKEFLQDMLSENELLCCFLEKKSIVNAVLWEPDLLPSPIVLNSCTSGSKVPERKSDDGCRTANIQCNLKDNCLSDDTACAIGTDCKYISTDSKSSNSRSVSEEAKIDDIDADEDDLPFDLSIDSGSLTCVACGILGYPFMAILQPSRKGLEEISLVDGEKCSLSSEKEKCLDEHPFSIKDDNSGYPCIANRSSCNHAELPCLVTVTEEQANFDHQNEEASKDAKADKDKFCLMQQELDQSCHQRCNSSHSCSSENTLHSCSEEDATNINLSRSGSLGSELSKQAGRDIDRQAIECCHNGINWNTSSVFARPRIFCLRHALEIEELLQGKGGAHVLVICHTDYLKLKALAISIAEEIEFQFDCKDVPLANASKSDLHIINTSIDDEGHEEDGRDWTSRLGLNLKYGVKLRKDAPGNQEQPSLFFRGLFSDPSPISIVPNLKWLCRKARTPYKVVGYASPRSPVAAIPEKVKPAVMRTDIGTVGNVYESRKRQHTLEQVGLLQQTGTGEPDDMTDIDMHCEENDYDGDYLVDIPIALAEYPLMHQVCEGTITVGTCNESICSLNLQDSPPLTTVSVEFTREQGRAQRTELGSSATVSVEQFPGNLNESICEGSSMNFVSNHKNLESQDDSLGYKDEQLQVQQETHENMELCNNPKKELDAALSEETHENTASAALENEGDGAKVSYCSDIILRTNKSAGADEPSYCSDILRTGKSARADEPETHDLVASPVTSELQSNCDEMTSRVVAQHRLTMGCLATTDSPCSSKLLFIANDLMGNGLQAIYNLEKHKDFASAVRVDVSQSIVESIELKSNDGKKLPSRSPNRDIINSKDAQAALSSSIPEQDGQLAKGSNFDILLGVLSQESKIADASKNDEVRKASSTLMTLTINDHSADVTQAEVAETAGSGGVSISDKAQSCSTLATDKLMVIQNHDIQQKQFANAEEIDTRNSEDFKDDVRILGGSANCVTTTCCLAKTSRSWVAAQEDQYIDGPNDLHMSDVVSRSIGNSKRTDILCYVRRKGKRKREQELKTGSSQICGSFVRGPCESLRPRTRPTIVEDITKKTTHADNSAANRGKTMRAGPFKCDIDFCNMTFQTKAELHAHKRNICIVESCGKRFSSHKYLKRHQCVHSDERPFKCPWDGCQMTFKWLWAQTEHVRVHTGERPYRCLAPGCGQRFRYVSDFSRHRKKFNHYMD